MADVELRKRVGERLRELRAQKRRTQEELAKAAGVSVEVVGRIERAETTPTLEILNSLCKGLRVSLEEFFSPESDDERQEIAEGLKSYLASSHVSLGTI